MPSFKLQDSARLSDLEYQGYILQGVSRTFALTIPQLPEPLVAVVGNAYLLCRIADTIEDDWAMNMAQKQRLAAQFFRVAQGEQPAQDFVAALSVQLAPQTPAAERDLIQNTARVVAITQQFSTAQREVILDCLRIMLEGMLYFQTHRPRHGLANMSELNSYCYHVAGVVGEMLTLLYAQHCDRIAARREEMLGLAVSFGQALQMTNILKDIWEDRARDTCWLPRDVFSREGISLDAWENARGSQGFRRGFESLIAIAHGHLLRSLDYTLLVPESETGLRRFCLLALYMAGLTLRNLQRRPAFTTGAEVKISRTQVKALLLAARLGATSDSAINLLFRMTTAGLPAPVVSELDPSQYRKAGYLFPG